ncbi:MAG: hypothetical protein JXA42_23130 [Anaerolineales bacterium]|nr:hypothetical protein [Anaerolineales bacterium]
MDHMKILKRSWEILWKYKALWVFGIILALTTGSSGNGSNYSFNGQDRQYSWEPFGEQIPPAVIGVFINIAIVLFCLICILAIILYVARFISETALIQMVDHYEETGEKYTIKEGFRLGWSRTAFNIFLIHLITGLPTFLVIMLLIFISAAPLLLWITKSAVLGVIGTIAAIGLFFLAIFLAIIVGVAITLLNRFITRACAMEELSIAESFRRGFELIRTNIKDIGIMWLIMVGLRFGYVMLMFPIVILLIGIAAVLGGLPALSIGGIASLLFNSGAVPWIIGMLVGIPIFILTLLIPLGFLGGLKEVYVSSTWTLTYRELMAMEGMTQGHLPELVEPELR